MLLYQSINSVFAIYPMRNKEKNTKLNFYSTNKESNIDQWKQEAAKGPLGHRVKQPLTLFENSAIWGTLLI